MAKNPRGKNGRSAAFEELPATLSQHVMDSFSDAVYIIDVRDYRVLACNTAFLKKHGFSASQVMGQPCYQLTHNLSEPCQAPFDICPLAETLKTGRHSRVEHIHFLVGGEKVFEEISTSPIFEKNGEIRRVVSVSRDVTARKRAEAALKLETEFSRTVMETISDAVSIVDVNNYRVLGFNAAFLEKIGLSEAEVLGRPCYELTHRGTQPCAPPDDDCPLSETVRTGKPAAAEHGHWLGNGEKAFAEVSTAPIFDENGQVLKVVHISRDITERKRMEESLAESESRFRGLAEKSLVGIYLVQDGVFRYLNPKFLEIFGYEMEDLIGRKGPKDLTLPEDWSTVEANLEKRVRGEIESIHYEFRGVTKTRRVVDLEVYGTRTVIGGRSAVIGTMLDISERKRAEKALAEKTQKLETLAQFDTLTGLYNRRGFLALAEQQLKTAVRLENPALLIFMDLDGFKEINDRLGHQVGDAALQEAAGLFRETFRQSDIVGRWGGDEFIMLAMGSDPAMEQAIFSRFEENLMRLNAAETRAYRLSLSIGKASYDPNHACSLEELVKRADIMMYRDKNAKKRQHPNGRSRDFIFVEGETP
jgi:diguanylate cyclase (GGDEF)-like protein/PAS domain S-box-containing protein